ncbi:MAG: alpha/beta fold hydrolase [Vulcanimicrobiaceae bacterium]
MSEVLVRFDDGAQTILERWGTSGPVMLLVHGMTSSRKGWERVARAFSDRYRVFAYDQRGHGDAALVHGPMALARGARDLQEVASGIEEPIDVVLGHSWGGTIAILGAASIGAKRVIAIDPMLNQAPDAWYAEYLAELDEVFALHGEARDARVREEYPGDPLDVEGKVHAMHAMSSAPIAGLQRENPAAMWPLPAALAALDRPLLLAMADPSESIVDAQTLAQVRALAPASVEIVTFAGQGHSLHRTGFDSFVREMRRFLEET